MRQGKIIINEVFTAGVTGKREKCGHDLRRRRRDKRRGPERVHGTASKQYSKKRTGLTDRPPARPAPLRLSHMLDCHVLVSDKFLPAKTPPSSSSHSNLSITLLLLHAFKIFSFFPSVKFTLPTLFQFIQGKVNRMVRFGK
nr:hypothetical protein Iba_chr05cCG5270 [Ipomoea batatas]